MDLYMLGAIKDILKSLELNPTCLVHGYYGSTTYDLNAFNLDPGCGLCLSKLPIELMYVYN